MHWRYSRASTPVILPKEKCMYQFPVNPYWQIQDQIFGYWFDQFMFGAIKMYYWPAFVAGISDNVTDLFKPQTYSICKI